MWIRSSACRVLALVQALLMASLGCKLGLLLEYSAGVRQYEERNLIQVPGGVVNAAGGYLILSRSDMSMDTIFGTREISAVYNAISGKWLWNFQIDYNGLNYVDETGADHDVSAIADGDPMPGTKWVKTDNGTVRTKGGLSYSFGADGRLDYIAWATQEYPRIRYIWDAAGVEIEQCTLPIACLGLFSIPLNPDGNPSEIVDARTGRRAELDYDEQGRLIAVRDALAIENNQPGFRYEYKHLGTLLTATTNSEGERVEYDYASGRRIWKVTQIGEGNPSHRFEYAWRNSDFLYPILHTNPLGGKTRYLFDARRRLREKELVTTGEKTLYTWQGLRPSTRIGPAGETTSYVYVDDELAQRTEPSGNVVTYTYEPGGLNFDDPTSRAIRRIEDSIGLVEEGFYDSLGRIETIANGEGETASFTYHTGSTLATTTAPGGIMQSYPIYGLHGHWLDRDGPLPDKRSFDSVGNKLVASTVFERGGVLGQTWNGGRQLTSLSVAASDPSGSVTTQGSIDIERRSDGQITRVTRPGGGDHEFLYDSLGRAVEEREFEAGVWRVTTTEFDLAGNVTARERPNGMRDAFEYDAYGRVTVRRASRDGAPEGNSAFVYSADRLTSYTDSIRGTSEQYAYDAAGRLVTTLFGYGEVLTREYDLRSRLTREAFSIPGTGIVADVGTAYDLANREIQLTDLAASEALIARLYEDGRLVQIVYGNGIARDYAYDADGFPIGFTSLDASSQTLESTTVAYTVEVNPPRQQIRTNTTTSLATTEEQYWLGLGGSLANPDAVIGKRVFSWNDAAGNSMSFAYDELSNRVSDPTGNGFVYNAERNRLLSATLAGSSATLPYTYDEAGFVTSRAGVPITWTATGRVASHGADTLVWDMQGRLVSRSAGGVERKLLWFGGRVEGDPIAGTLGALDLGEVSIDLSSSERLYRHLDFRQNVRFTSNDTGQVVSHYHYSPYGVESVFGAADGSSTFVGRAELGELMILGFRVYDPAIGRFLSPDPIFQLVNPYSYTLGNPVWFSDPDGDSFLEKAAAGSNFASAVFALGAAYLAYTGAGGIGLLLAAAAFYTLGAGLSFLDSLLSERSGCDCGNPTVRIIDHATGNATRFNFGGLSLSF